MESDIGKGLLFLIMSFLLFNPERNVDLFVSLVIALVGMINIVLYYFAVDIVAKGYVKNVLDDDENESLLSFYMKKNGDHKP